jgi:hypothetical protein
MSPNCEFCGKETAVSMAGSTLFEDARMPSRKQDCRLNTPSGQTTYDPSRSQVAQMTDPESRRQLIWAKGGLAPIMAVQTSGAVSPERSVMGVTAIGWSGWISVNLFQTGDGRNQTLTAPRVWSNWR